MINEKLNLKQTGEIARLRAELEEANTKLYEGAHAMRDVCVELNDAKHQLAQEQQAHAATIVRMEEEKKDAYSDGMWDN